MQSIGRLTSLGRLRGLAALCVVFGHAFHVQSLTPAQYAFNPAFLIISSATVIFVLIAGILFRIKAVSRLVNGDTCTRTIFCRRWAELSGTYLTVGLFLAVVVGYKEGIREGVSPFFYAFQMMLNGSMAHSYWYVPFFLILMALAPSHVWFCRLKLPVQVFLIIFGMIISAFIHRPNADVTLGAVHSLAYYLPVFWLGLVLGSYWQEILKWLHGKEILLGILMLCCVALQVEIGQDQVYLHKIGENWGDIDLFIIQKVLFSLIFISVFHRTQALKMPLFDWLSKNSLVIFFMHCPVLILITSAPHLSGFYVPDLVLVTIITIVGGVQMHKSLVRTFARLPDGVKGFAETIREARLSERFPRGLLSFLAPSVKG
ncbi:acyltransferase [Sagittula sp. NFXS13]|uniref:acyltransferase family protein n=1 Tax=Sagittula sp. NFXS13 TaxID=2819095 RepID=UPI0032DFB0AC